MLKIDIDKVKYSLLAYFDTNLTREDEDKIKRLLKEGRKIILLLSRKVNFDLAKLSLDEFKQHKLLQIHKIPDVNCGSFYIIDGKIDVATEEALNKVSTVASNFNAEQYRVEHLSPEANTSVEAGAGTGKTTVMIDRVMFLLHMVENLLLKDIVMITFTNDATQNMRHRLQKELLIRYKLTQKEKYLNYLEEESQMRIQTIHSFSKYLISEVGTAAGYGRNIRIKSFVYERKELINEILDEDFKKRFKDDSVFSVFKGSLYQFVKIIDNFWTKLENEGISLEEIEDFDWGEPFNEESSSIHIIVKEIFNELEKRFSIIKKKNNALALKDITRELDIIKYEVKNLHEKIHPIKYLFVDEFQDTDNTQIELVAWLNKELKTRIFAVGDIKQSIYRFRGATYTAFSELASRIPEKIVPMSLNKNYRTSADILDKLQPMFKKWDGRNLITYKKENILKAMNKEAGSCEFIKVTSKETEIRSKTIEVLNAARVDLEKHLKAQGIEDIKIAEHEKIAVLVRANYEAEKIKNWCSEAGIACYVEAGGTFYKSRAVRDFYNLISSYLYEDEPSYKINLLASPYSRASIGWRVLWKCRGDKGRLNSEINKKLEEDNFDKYREYFRLKPVMAVIREIIKEIDPVSRFAEMHKTELESSGKYLDKELEKQVKIDTRQYHRNLNYLLEKLRQKFSGDFVSLYKIHKYLELQIAVNREEDEKQLEEEEIGNSVRCLTVHKSKGLEFDTVIIPFTNRKFRRENQNEILFGKLESKRKAGWNIVVNKHGEIKIYKSGNYNLLVDQEVEETAKEETRLLYVALTRSIRKLICIKSGSRENTWANLL